MITSRSNPLVRSARLLRDRRARTETGLFMAEGIHLVGAALEAGWNIHAVLFAASYLRSEFGLELVERARRTGQRVEEVSPDVMDSLAGKDHPQGILAVVEQRRLRLSDVAVQSHAGAVESPQDPGNVGSLLRTLDAFSGDALILIGGGVDPFHPTAVRAGMGAHFWVPIVAASAGEFLDWARGANIQVLGTSSHGKMDLGQARPRRPWVLLLGSEQKGLSDELRRGSDMTIRIPMRGHTSSLNLAAAAAIMIHAFALEDSETSSSA